MLDDLKAFVAVMEKTSLTKAADSLSLTQSAVSRRVQQLEDALGAMLLDRSSRPPTATAVGRRVHQAATAILRDVERLVGIAKEDGEPSGTFRIGFPQVVADVALYEIAVRLKASFPSLGLRCRTGWSSSLQLLVAEGELDAAVLMLPSGSSAPPEMVGQRIARFEVLVVQSKRRPLVSDRAEIAALAMQEWILNPEGCGYRAALQRAFDGAGQELRLGVDVHGTESQLRLVAAGIGLGLVPRSLLGASAHRNELAVVDISDFSLTLDLWLVHALSLGNLARALDVLHLALTQPPAGQSEGRT